MAFVLRGFPSMCGLMLLLLVVIPVVVLCADVLVRTIDRNRCKAHNARYYARRPHLRPATPAAGHGPSGAKKPVVKKTHAKH